MTLREEALELINRLPDKVMEDIVRVLKKKDNDPKTWETPEQQKEREARELAERREAFRWLEEMRKTKPLLIPENYEEVYADAMAEKYGVAK